MVEMKHRWFVKNDSISITRNLLNLVNTFLNKIGIEGWLGGAAV